jgi:hypothetical protein
MALTQNWSEPDGSHDGGVSYGDGFCISWQRGPLSEAGRNGAFLIEVLEACRDQLAYFDSGKYACTENAAALEHLTQAIQLLEQRRQRRTDEGKLGTSVI